MALAAVGDPHDPVVVRALLRLVDSGLRLGHGGWIHRFIERGDEKVRSQFVETLKKIAVSDIEAIHQLVGLGKSGISALVDVYYSLDSTDPMRGQIASYTDVRKLLGYD